MTNTHELEDGFYWVRDGGEWVVVRIDENRVYFTGHDVYELASHIDEIDPRPIKRDNHVVESVYDDERDRRYRKIEDSARDAALTDWNDMDRATECPTEAIIVDGIELDDAGLEYWWEIYNLEFDQVERDNGNTN